MHGNSPVNSEAAPQAPDRRKKFSSLDVSCPGLPAPHSDKRNSKPNRLLLQSQGNKHWAGKGLQRCYSTGSHVVSWDGPCPLLVLQLPLLPSAFHPAALQGGSKGLQQSCLLFSIALQSAEGPVLSLSKPFTNIPSQYFHFTSEKAFKLQPRDEP